MSVGQVFAQMRHVHVQGTIPVDTSRKINTAFEQEQQVKVYLLAPRAFMSVDAGLVRAFA